MAPILPPIQIRKWIPVDQAKSIYLILLRFNAVVADSTPATSTNNTVYGEGLGSCLLRLRN
jgi:hypothetical protein